MGVKIRSINDITDMRMGTEVTCQKNQHGLDAMDSSIDSPELVGEKNKHYKTVKQCQRDNIRNHINLCKPILNRVLSNNGTIVAKVLGVNSNHMSRIMDFTLVMLEDELVSVTDLMPDDEFLAGGELILHLIDKFDPEEAIIEEFEEIVDKSCPKYKPLEHGEIVKGVTDGNAINLCCGYKFRISDDTKPDDIKILHDFLDDCMTRYFYNNKDSRISYLLYDTENVKNRLYSLVQTKISVLPIGMRPKMGNRINRITKLYGWILTCNQRLLLNEKFSDSTTRVYMYKKLDEAVASLQYKDIRVWKSEDKVGAVSMLEKVKSKKGQIRNNNLGKRQDYTGRAAVIVSPYLSINKIRIPKKMLVKIFMYHLLPYLNSDDLTSGHTKEDIEKKVQIILNKGLLDKVPVVLGRQPTLHKHSLQAFMVEPTDASAIEVNPLVCPGYNMDFDGDTGHTGVPLSDEAIREVKSLMTPSKNIFLPKTGECALVPRQDMLYGLYCCTRSNYVIGTPVGEFKSYKSVCEAVLSHSVKVSDTVNVNGEHLPAGYAAFMSCFPMSCFKRRDKRVIKEVTSKTINYYVELLLQNIQEYGHNKFISALDSLVELGFKVAYFNTKSVSLLKDMKEIPEYDTAMADFHANTAELEYLYSIGMEDSDTYNLEYENHISVLRKRLEGNVKEKIGDDSAYLQMAVSGARGNVSNLVQMFAFKGRIAASATESINVCVWNSYSSQLSPLEGFIAAYGGRKGQMDKTLKTGDTGYASRLLWHTTQDRVIVCEDCGTTEGLTLSHKDIGHFIKDDKERVEAFVSFITGRYLAGSNKLISEADARNLVNTQQSVTIRTPLKCKNPCCAKCYGLDPSTRERACIGLPVGLIAAMSVGEPASQLTMKQFQKGGVANKGDVTANFDRFFNYISLKDISEKGSLTNYEPIAWESGEVHTVEKDNHIEVSIGDSGESIKVAKGVSLKDTVVKGEGICAGEYHGDFYIREIEEILGIDAAQKYLTLMLYNLYKDDCKIILKHFEIIVDCMTQYLIIDTDRKDLRVGHFADKITLLSGSLANTKYVKKLLGVKSIPAQSLHPISTIAMEEVTKGISRSVALGLDDNMDVPIDRFIMGKAAKMGTLYPDFLFSRSSS